MYVKNLLKKNSAVAKNKKITSSWISSYKKKEKKGNSYSSKQKEKEFEMFFEARKKKIFYQHFTKEEKRKKLLHTEIQKCLRVSSYFYTFWKLDYSLWEAALKSKPHFQNVLQFGAQFILTLDEEGRWCYSFSKIVSCTASVGTCVFRVHILHVQSDVSEIVHRCHAIGYWKYNNLSYLFLIEIYFRYNLNVPSNVHIFEVNNFEF